MSKKTSNIDRSKIDLEQFKAILDVGGGTMAGLSRYVGRSHNYYFDRLMYQQRLHRNDIAKLEEYLGHIGGPTTFEDSYNIAIREKQKNNNQNKEDE